MNKDINPSFACSLEAHGFQERLAWIAELNQQYLLGSLRSGSTLILTYTAAARSQIEELVARERECCSFLSFHTSLDNEHVELRISVPTSSLDNAEALLAPFQVATATAGATDCCGSCDFPEPPKATNNTTTKTVIATTATAVAACAACCAIPLVGPAIAAGSTGGLLLAWTSGAQAWLITLVAIAVSAAWYWRRRKSLKERASAAAPAAKA